MCGELDGCIPPDIFVGYENWFDAPADLIIVPGAGHFLPIDAPNAIIDQIL
jgi:pimeloyl-ACP methyl ester carboxylesterase